MTMSEQKDNLELEEYLKGNSFISRRYRKEAMAEPSPHLDAAIIAAAKKAAENKKTVSGPFTARWYIPLSLAAVVVISFSVVFKIYDRDEQQIFSKQSGTKPEKPAMIMDDKIEHDAGVPARIMRDESFLNGGIGIESESVSRGAPAAMEDISPDASVSGKQAGPPAAQTPESVPAPLERRMMESSKQSKTAEMQVISSTLEPDQWFEIINQLWFDGDEEGAYRSLKNFLAVYPEYPVEQLKNKLPQNMDLSAITGKLDKTTEGTE